MKKITFLLLFVSQIGFSQTNSVSGIIESLDFKQDTVLTVFNWITDNVAYDVALLNQMKKANKSSRRGKTKAKGKGQSQEERDNDKLVYVLKKKKGVCEHYAILFDRILSQLGYQSHIISGYTKDKKGKINGDIGHAWNAVSRNGEWQLYDATWAAGYVRDGKKFVRQYFPEWYNCDPDKMIKSHMPHDPIWQFKTDVFTYKDFKNPNKKAPSKNTLDYRSEIKRYTAQADKDKMKDQLRRSEELGDGNKLVRKWRSTLSKRIAVFDIANNLDDLNKMADLNNIASKRFNEYFKAKNKKFKSKKWTVSYAEEALLEIKEQIETSLEVYNNVEVDDRKAKKQLKSAIKSCDKFLKKVNQELAFMEGIKGKD